jgi:hypothetical protein
MSYRDGDNRLQDKNPKRLKTDKKDLTWINKEEVFALKVSRTPTNKRFLKKCILLIAIRNAARYRCSSSHIVTPTLSMR